MDDPVALDRFIDAQHPVLAAIEPGTVAGQCKWFPRGRAGAATKRNRSAR